MRGNLYIVSAPSGTGKTALVAALLRRQPELCLSISYTTREIRATESHGVHYFFTDRNQFERMRQVGDFLECAEYKGNWYGTGRQFVDEHLRAGKDVVLEIEVQGARQVKERIPESVSVFLLPPSRDVLRERLRRRAVESNETEDDIQKRLALAESEIGCWGEYDHLIVNDGFEDAADLLEAVVLCHRTLPPSQRLRIEEIISSFGGSV